MQTFVPSSNCNEDFSCVSSRTNQCSRNSSRLFGDSFSWFGFRLPPLSVPSLSRISNISSDAFVIAVVIFATNISLAKMFAKKRGYAVEPNQVCLASIDGWWVLGKTLFFTAPPPPLPCQGVWTGAGKLSGKTIEMRKISPCDGLASYLT